MPNIMNKLHIIAVAYERTVPLRILIDSFIVQTCPDWILYVVYDGIAPKHIIDILKLYRDDKRIILFESEKRMGNFGHPNRASMLQNIKGNNDDFVLITNDDNYYVPKFVEYFLYSVNENIGMVYCNTLHSYYAYDVHVSVIKEKYIDMGCFMVRFDIAQQTGFNHYNHSADGLYAEECEANCKRKGLQTRYIPKALFIHN
jgi:hypothetical protein